MSLGRTGICNVYASGGTCRFGTNCRFLHFRPPNYRIPQGYPQQNFEHESLSSDQEAIACVAQSYSNYDPQQFGSYGHHDEPKVCRFYHRNGYCRYGQQCKYQHDNPVWRVRPCDEGPTSLPVEQAADVSGDNVSLVPYQQQHPSEVKEASRKRLQVCTYFRKGNCRFGEKCRFLHPKDASKAPVESHDSSRTDGQAHNQGEHTDDQAQAVEADGPREGTDEQVQQAHQQLKGLSPELHNQDQAAASEQTEAEQHPQPDRFGPKQQFQKEELLEDECLQLRDRELEVVRKRYPDVERTENSDDNSTSMTFTFHPSDPEWPYDAKTVRLSITFPCCYPLEACLVAVLEDDIIPQTVCHQLEAMLNEWLRKRFSHMTQLGRVELVFRSFLKWLDREIEELFTDSLKTYQKVLQAEAAGMKFVPAETLRHRYAPRDDETRDDESRDDETEKERWCRETKRKESGEEEEMDRRMKELHVEQTADGPSAPAARGTEVRLHSLQLGDKAGTMTCTHLALTVQCTRCTHNTELDTPSQRTNCITCPRCKNNMGLGFRSAMCHQFSDLLGYLDLDQCKPVDLVLPKCQFKVNCLECYKDMGLEGLLPGTSKSSWCHSCHSKMTIGIETVKFYQLQASTIDTSKSHNVSVQKLVRNVKDPAIQVGRPLPENGVCKHYKKSFRWFRFPCCGKTYPCDVCHEEQEAHEMKLATRVVCGYCSKEQPFSTTQPCTGCHAWMTKRSTSHWEGGKGCRDPLKMSRNDSKKYANLSKTTPNKK